MAMSITLRNLKHQVRSSGIINPFPYIAEFLFEF